jgi:hypothetical protein
MHFATVRRVVNAANKNKRVPVEGSLQQRMFWRDGRSRQNKFFRSGKCDARRRGSVSSG